MDPIELEYDDINSIPEAFRPLYEETDGKFTLSRVNGLKTQRDVDTVREALRKEREDHRKAQTSLKAWGDLSPEEVRSQLDRIPELEAAAEGKIDEDKINQIVTSRISQKTGPLERQLREAVEKSAEIEKERDALVNQIETRDRNDAVRAIATELKAHGTAIPDIEMAASLMLEKDESGNLITRSDFPGLTPGLDIKGWMREMMKLRPHWWPESEGGGSRGSGAGGFGGNNPWSKDHWNLTEQGKILREQGRDVAEKMARMAGRTFG